MSAKHPFNRRVLWGLCVAAAIASTGCASAVVPPPVLTDTHLGSVVIYRNGVAYFERTAPSGQKELTMRVPAERVDDFLKSLSIVDVETGNAMAISYPTLQTYEGYTEMAIKLPARHGQLKISYVTESPSWKPSYRVVLDEGDKATLQGWAVVDNVSGEDWKKVRVGVGSTSALSFRYDLHSVRLVERQTLSTGEPLAAAPPTGGSPYAVATKKVRVLGSLSQTDMSGQQQPGPTPTLALDSVSRRGGDDDGKGEGRALQTATRAARGQSYIRGLSAQLKNRNQRVRIEGYAQAGDPDAKRSSLARANQVRDQLVAQGVPAGNIEVVGTGKQARDAVRILEGDEIAGQQGGAGDVAARDTLPIGSAHFLSLHAMTIENEHSAMVSILKAPTVAKRVYYYDPVSPRGSQRYAFNSIRIDNPTEHTLDGGPFTVYAKGQFLGEGLSDAILPNSKAFIPYALDRSIIVEPEVDNREEVERLLTIQRGIVTSETRRIRRTKLTISNRGKDEAKVFVRHRVAQGFELAEKNQRMGEVEKMGGAHLFAVTVPAGDATDLVIEEWTPLMKTVDIRTDSGIKEIALFLKKRKIDPDLRAKLDDIVRTHMKSADMVERQRTLQEQIDVYATRERELNFQLATLRKVPQAAKLRQHLAKRMEEISDRTQKATLALSELKGEQMTLRIDLQDKLADLTLKRPDKGADGADRQGKVAAKK